MTVETYAPPALMTISGAGPYPFNHALRATEDIDVFVMIGSAALQLFSPDFTVTKNAGSPGGTVVLSAPIATTHAGRLLRIDRSTRIEQGWIGGTSREKGLERQIDAGTMALQEVRNRLDRAIVMPRGDGPVPELGADAPSRAGQLLGFDVAGRPTVRTIGSLPTTYLGIGLIGLSAEMADRPPSAGEGDAWGLLVGGTVRVYVWHLGAWSDAGALAHVQNVIGTGTTAAAAETIMDRNIVVPEGVFVSPASTGASLGKNYRGFGQIQTLDGNRLAPVFTNISAPPVSLGSHLGPLTAFNGDISRSPFQIAHIISGAATLGQPAAGYTYQPESMPFYLYMLNQSGHNQDLASNEGRTGTAAIRVKLGQIGQGDATCFNGSVFVAGAKPGATHFLANPAGALFGGDMQAGQNGVYLNARELILQDYGFDVAAIGDVVNLERTNATGALSTFWGGYRVQSIGSAAVDSILSATGKYRVGIDFAMTPTDFGGDQAAVSLKAGQRVYFNNAANAAGALEAGWRTTVFNGDYISYDLAVGGVVMVVGGVPVLQAKSDQLTFAPTGSVRAPSYRASAGTPTGVAGELTIGNTTSSSANAGGVAIPPTCAKFLVVTLDGVIYKLPLFVQ